MIKAFGNKVQQHLILAKRLCWMSSEGLYIISELLHHGCQAVFFLFFFWRCLSIFLDHIWLPKLACRAWEVWQASLKFQSDNREASPGTSYMEASEPVELQWEMEVGALCGKIFVSKVNSSVVRAGFEVQSIIKQRPLLPHLPESILWTACCSFPAGPH